MSIYCTISSNAMHKRPEGSREPNNAPKTSWGPVDAWYDEHLEGEDTYHTQVILPNLLRLVGPKAGMTILDVACGQGFFAKHLSEKGASILGVDISTELIARATVNAPRAQFFTSPANNLSMINSDSVNHAILTLAIQNIEDVGGVCKEVARVLRPKGAFTIIMNHPAFRIPKASSWGFDQKTDTEYRRLDGYLSESRVSIDMHPGIKIGASTISFHRPLQWYVKHLTKHGLLVDRLEEWTSNKTSVGKRAKAENKARKEFPLFLALRSVKS